MYTDVYTHTRTHTARHYLNNIIPGRSEHLNPQLLREPTVELTADSEWLPVSGELGVLVSLGGRGRGSSAQGCIAR